MSKYLGDFAAGVTVRGTFNTRAKATGAPIAMAGSPALAVYKDGNTTETTTGVVLTEAFDSRVGHHLFAITTTDAFYATGSDYRIVLTAGTVDGESVVGVEVGSFSIQNRFMRGTDGANTTTPLNAAGTRSALGLASANLDTQLGDIPTVAEFNARTILAASYLVAANLPANFSSLVINESGHIERVILVDTTTTNTDMRGTDGANTATPLDAAGTRTALGLASANIDTQLTAIGNITSGIATEVGKIPRAASAVAAGAFVMAITAGQSAEVTYSEPA
jgi:hypothetical protein